VVKYFAHSGFIAYVPKRSIAKGKALDNILARAAYLASLAP